MPTHPEAHDYILALKPYKAGKSAVAGADRVIKLSSNESPFGPSPKALEAMQRALPGLNRYPDGSAQALRDAIAEHHGLPAEQIVCGNGSDQLIQLLLHAYAGPGDNIVYSEHGFLMYKIYAQGFGIGAIAAPEKHYTAQVDALLAAVKDNTRILFLANPNNPTGTCLPASEIRRLREHLRDDILLVLDAAYAEYVQMPDYDAGAALVAETVNTIMLRTFSKAYALPGLRLGWGYACPAIIEVLNRLRGPFDVNSMALAAGEAATQDQAHLQQGIGWNSGCLRTLPPQLEALGVTVHPSEGNFLMLEFPDDTGKTAADANAYLLARGIILREIAAYGLPNHLRMTIGLDEENDEVIAALSAFMRGTE